MHPSNPRTWTVRAGPSFQVRFSTCMNPYPNQIEDQALKPIAAKVFAGERLTFEEGVRLYESNDLLAIGHLANYVREERHGNVTYFNVNRHINPTNVCVASCKLCASARFTHQAKHQRAAREPTNALDVGGAGRRGCLRRKGWRRRGLMIGPKP